MRRVRLLLIGGAVALVFGITAHDVASAASKSKNRPRTTSRAPAKGPTAAEILAEKPDPGPITMPISLDAKPGALKAPADAPVSLDLQPGFRASGPRSLDR